MPTQCCLAFPFSAIVSTPQVLRVPGDVVNNVFQPGPYCEDSRYGIQGDTIFGFKNVSAISMDIGGKPFWVIIHGQKPNDRGMGMPHDQHLVYCTQVPQAVLEPRRGSWSGEGGERYGIYLDQEDGRDDRKGVSESAEK